MSFVILAAETFVVDDIRVEGLERITPGAIFNYLPIGVGAVSYKHLRAHETSLHI